MPLARVIFARSSLAERIVINLVRYVRHRGEVDCIYKHLEKNFDSQPLYASGHAENLSLAHTEELALDVLSRILLHAFG